MTLKTLPAIVGMSKGVGSCSHSTPMTSQLFLEVEAISSDSIMMVTQQGPSNSAKWAMDLAHWPGFENCLVSVTFTPHYLGMEDELADLTS